MEAITDIMNEVQVRQSGEDIGYLNVRKEFDGRLVNTIDLDPARHKLIRWAFEQYASDQRSVWQLAEHLDDQGLTTGPSAKQPARPLSPSALAKNLRDPYYTGAIRFTGALYAGRHQAIVSKTTFLTV